MRNEDDQLAACARCPYESKQRKCYSEHGRSIPGCPSEKYGDLTEKSMRIYADSDLLEFARQASIQEGEGYTDRELGYELARPCKSRLQETIEFAEKMGFRRLGLAFCVGLRREAAVTGNFLIKKGFQVSSVSCKAGGISKEEIGITDDQKIAPGTFETMCNPVMQALVLNRESTELNIALGLCVGHDSIFFMHSDAPCTVLAVKDRVLGHNPLAAVYTIDSYYRSLKKI